MCVCVCVCVCARTRVCASVYDSMYVRVCLYVVHGVLWFIAVCLKVW